MRGIVRLLLPYVFMDGGGGGGGGEKEACDKESDSDEDVLEEELEIDFDDGEHSDAGEGTSVPEAPSGSSEEGGAEEQPWAMVDPSYMTGPNSPTKIASKSIVWKTIRRLKPGHPKISKGFTHACIEPNCGSFITLWKPKGKSYWTNTKAGQHIQKYHGDCTGKEACEKSEKAQVRLYATQNCAFAPV